MADQNKDPQEKVSLEELLRMKRCERPDQQFWQGFDRELHQRMLQSLVKKDPWYVQIMRGFTGRIGQFATVSGMALLLMMTIGRTYWQSANEPVQVASIASQSISDVLMETETVEVTEAAPVNRQMTASMSSVGDSVKQYQMDAIQNAAASAESRGYKREFALESLHVANYDRAVYSSDLANAAVSIASTSVASLVY